MYGALLYGEYMLTSMLFNILFSYTYIIYILQVNINGAISFDSGKNAFHLYLCDIWLNLYFQFMVYSFQIVEEI